MPKGKRRGKSERYENAMQNSDNESSDNVSTYSCDTKSVNDEIDDELQQERFEERLIELMDGLTQKSSKGRLKCLQNISATLVSKYAPQFVSDRQVTLVDGIERCLKKGSTEEKIAACELASILCLQLDPESDGEDVCKTLKPLLVTIVSDNSTSAVVRGKCCASLVLLTYVSDCEMGDILSLMRLFEGFFSGSYHKGDGSNNNVTQEQANFHAAALNAWGLLLTNMDSNSIRMMLDTKSLISFRKMAELLESPHLEVRMSAGDVLALLYEAGNLDHDDFGNDFDEIITSLRSLATDSLKYRAKKDRKQQRASFRDILTYIEEDIIPESSVKFGREVLSIDSWCKMKHYDMFCTILGPGINIHLVENNFLRSLLEIPEHIGPIPGSYNVKYQAELEKDLRKRQIRANFKARSIAQRVTRDKRIPF